MAQGTASSGERSKLEIEAVTAYNIIRVSQQDIAALEQRWPVAKRGSNGQRALDQLKERIAAAELCLKEALGR